MRTQFGRLVVATFALALVALPSRAAAAPLGITCPGGLQPLPQATFGGAGIPNHAVCQVTLNVGQDVITLGLTATARFANSAVTDDGVGTFYAEYGGDTLNAAPTFARWNWDWFIDVNGTGTYAFELLYDFDPGANTDAAQLGRINPAAAAGPFTVQDSWNNGMAFLGVTGGVVTRPTIPGAFDPNAAGQFSFGIIARQGALELGRVSMNVETVPEPATLGLIRSRPRRRCAPRSAASRQLTRTLDWRFNHENTPTETLDLHDSGDHPRDPGGFERQHDVAHR